MEISMRVLAACLACSLLTLVALATAASAVDTADTIAPNEPPDLASVRARIKSGDFKGALAELTPMAETRQNADVYNLMGFSLRKTGNLDQALTYYRKALDLDPQHRGALEYLGELYVQTGQMDKAAQNVARLKALCPTGCEELADLEQAIAAAGASK
jgi:Flp pilus assembly protein TadD